MSRVIDKISLKLEKEFGIKFDDNHKKQLMRFLEAIMFEKTLEPETLALQKCLVFKRPKFIAVLHTNCFGINVLSLYAYVGTIFDYKIISTTFEQRSENECQ